MNELTEKEKSIIKAALFGLPLAMLASEATADEISELDATQENVESIKIKLGLS